MRLKDLLQPVHSIEPAEAKNFMEDHKEGSYLLLDVRETKEYEREHLPGAKLIPLSQLTDSFHLMDPDKPVLVY